MTTVRTLYSDQWGDILDRPEDDCVEIRWFDTSTDMSGDDFNEFLGTYAGHVEVCGRRGALVDAVQFRMDFAKMNLGWRDENIIPRYNAAGVQKFAFLLPGGHHPSPTIPPRKVPRTFRPGTSTHVKRRWRGSSGKSARSDSPKKAAIVPLTLTLSR